MLSNGAWEGPGRLFPNTTHDVDTCALTTL